MVQYVIKRDGRIVPFNKQKIVDVILKAFKATDKCEPDEYAKSKAENIATFIENREDEELSVEEIQDLVSKGLMSTKRKDVAEQFVIFRHDRTMYRENNLPLNKLIDEKLKATNVVNQNANVDEHSFGGRKGEAINAYLKEKALNNMPKKFAKNHKNNRVYIHDLDSYTLGMHNCLSLPLDDLLSKNVHLKQTDLRPANSVGTAMQLVAVYFQVQSLQQFGGVSATHLDWTMVPYVRASFFKHYRIGLKYVCGYSDALTIQALLSCKNIKEQPVDALDFYHEKNAYVYAMDMVKNELKQSCEGLFHNLNSLQSRSGNQLPFSSINYGTCTLPEGRMVIEALLNASISGVGPLHKTAIFPCSIFQYMKGVNDKPGTPNYDMFRLALKSTAKRLYPNYANVDWSGNAGYDINDPRTYFSTMGCRTANGFDINGFGQLKDGRGNIAPVTIILPTLAMEAKESFDNTYDDNIIDVFLNILDKAITDAKDELIERFEYICSQPADAADFMYSNGTMAGYVPEEGIRSALKHGTLAIGQVGVAEALQILIGKDHTTPEGMEVAKLIEQLYKTRCAEFKEKYKLNFGVYFSPAENLCHTAMKAFKKQYGEIPNVSDREYFTNSMHVPVWKKISPFDKIDIEAQLTGYSSAGCITYVELDTGMENNIDGLETLVTYAMDKDIPYFAINIPNDTCDECGECGDIPNDCPICGSKKITRLRRVTGYLSVDYHNFNKGKIAEVEDRFKHGKLIDWNNFNDC